MFFEAPGVIRAGDWLTRCTANQRGSPHDATYQPAPIPGFPNREVRRWRPPVGGVLRFDDDKLYAQGEQLHIAPTADTGVAWQATPRHIAYEGRIFVVSCCQVLRRSDDPALSGFPGDAEWLMSGGSAIVSPTGNCDYLAGPVYEQ